MYIYVHYLRQLESAHTLLCQAFISESYILFVSGSQMLTVNSKQMKTFFFCCSCNYRTCLY